MLGKIVQQVSRYSGQDEMIQKLRSNIEALICQAADINKELEEAEFRSGKKRKHEVENWLRNVEWTENKVQNLDQEVGGRKISSLLIGNRVDKLNGEIAELREQGRIPRGLLFDMRETEEPLVTSKLIGQAFEQNLKEIWACLMDDEVLRIGIYGMGGVGKSSLAVHTYNRLLKKSESVYWITVSQDFSIGKLQADIAKTLKLEFSNEDEKKKAAKLTRALTRRKNCILILDDVWKQIPLDIVGIPNSVNGCKVILTTRLFDVCRKMDCQANFKVEPLSEEEAWDLFRGKLGQHTTLSPEVKNIAMSVAAKCSGLPLGIITMAASMRGVNDICEWRSVFEELKVFTMGQEDMENEVFPILKFSYSRLTDQDLQLCFLYCALYPEDCKIERNELIGSFIAEKLIDKWKSWQAKFDMGNTMLNKLERSCLLESCKDNGGNRCVMVHDLIRDMALKITNECHPRFMVKAGLGLKEIPDEQEWIEDLDKVSLMKNEIAEIRCGQSLRCHKLSTLILKDNPLKRIANSFFECMHALQFLDLSENYVIVELPNSISNLENLTTLLLRRCIHSHMCLHWKSLQHYESWTSVGQGLKEYLKVWIDWSTSKI
ncbi:hypothetical protein ACSBR2_038010 [Camellia fascicularis]